MGEWIDVELVEEGYHLSNLQKEASLQSDYYYMYHPTYTHLLC